jgi:hypothetical protein
VRGRRSSAGRYPALDSGMALQETAMRLGEFCGRRETAGTTAVTEARVRSWCLSQSLPMVVREFAPGWGFAGQSLLPEPAPNVHTKTASASPMQAAVNGLRRGAPVGWAVPVCSAKEESAGRSRSGATDWS